MTGVTSFHKENCVAESICSMEIAQLECNGCPFVSLIWEGLIYTTEERVFLRGNRFDQAFIGLFSMACV